MNITNITMTAVALALIGCGGGGSSSDTKDTTTGETTSTKEKNTLNGIDKVGELKQYFYISNKLVSGEQKTSCIPTGNGKGKIITQLMAGSTAQFLYKEYNTTRCVGEVEIMKVSNYSLAYGKEINGGKAIEANLRFDSGDNIVDKVPNHMLGYNITDTFYTTIVASGKSVLDIKFGIAKPTTTSDGSSPDKRANDVSDYTSGTYYFSR